MKRTSKSNTSEKSQLKTMRIMLSTGSQIDVKCEAYTVDNLGNLILAVGTAHIFRAQHTHWCCYRLMTR